MQRQHSLLSVFYEGVWSPLYGALRHSGACVLIRKLQHELDCNCVGNMLLTKYHSQSQMLCPDFEAMAWCNGLIKVRLSDYKGIFISFIYLFHIIGKYVVLFFYTHDFSFVCPTEIIEFSDRAKEFRECSCEVIGCSVDSQYTHM